MLVIRPSGKELAIVALLALEGSAFGWGAWRLGLERLEPWALIAAVGALAGLVMAVRRARGFLRGIRTVTLSRGRIEVRQGPTRRTYGVRDFRFVAACRTRATSSGVGLWLAVNPPDSPREDVLGGWVELGRYDEGGWGPREERQLEAIERALGRLRLREQVPVGVPSPDGPAPRFDLPWARLDPSLRELLASSELLASAGRDLFRGEHLLRHGVRYFVDGSRPTEWRALLHLGLALAMLTAALALPYVALALAAPWPAFLAVKAARDLREAWRLQGEGLPRGLYLFTDMLVAVRSEGVTVIPRSHLLAFTWAGAEGLTLHFRSPEGTREQWDAKLRLPESPEQLLGELEAWRKRGGGLGVSREWGSGVVERVPAGVSRSTSGGVSAPGGPREDTVHEDTGEPAAPVLFAGLTKQGLLGRAVLFVLLGVPIFWGTYSTYMDELELKRTRADMVRVHGQVFDAVVVDFYGEYKSLGRTRRWVEYAVLEYQHEGKKFRLVDMEHEFLGRRDWLLGKTVQVRAVPGSTSYFKVLSAYE